MTERIIVDVQETENGRVVDYEYGFDDAIYWDDERAKNMSLEKGEVAILPHDE